MKCLLVLPILLLLAPLRLHAQDPDTTRVRLLLVDGEEMTGRVLSETADVLNFVTLTGIEMALRKSQIREIRRIESDRFERLDPNRSRLLFAPTGRSLEKKEGYVAVYELLFPFVTYAPGYGIALSGGVTLIPGASGQVVYAAPKLTVYETSRTALALGFLGAGYIGSDDEFSPVGLVYGVATRGSRERSGTLGMAFGWSDEEFSTKPVIMFGAHSQVSNSVAILTENYIVTSEKDLMGFMAGIRFFGNRLSVDLALATILEALKDPEGWPFLPWVGFAYNFGPK